MGVRRLISIQQLQAAGRREAHRDAALTPGSVILFGSTLRGNFVLDTVFVVADDPRQFIPARADRLGEDDASFYTTLDAINSLDEPFRRATLTLYRGATSSTPVTGMYCFTPCLPSNGDGHLSRALRFTCRA